MTLIRLTNAKSRLSLVAGKDEIVRIYREKIEDGWAKGYVVSAGRDVFVLQLIDDTIRFDGYLCARYSDVTRLDIPAPHSKFIEKALKARGLDRPVTPQLDVSSLPALLRSAGEISQLVTIHVEYEDESVCYIGKVVSVENSEIILHEISPDGEWDETPESYSLSIISGVGFGGSYEEALLLVAGDSDA